MIIKEEYYEKKSGRSQRSFEKLLTILTKNKKE